MANESPDSGTPAAPSDQPTPVVAIEPVQPVSPMDATAAPASTAADAPDGRCPWCSAGLALGAGLPSCPSCGAHLSSGDDAVMPGLTQVVPVTLQKQVSSEPVRRSRLLAWISGEMIDEPRESEATPDALALPSRDVRREMLRLELEAAGIAIPPEMLAPVVAPDPATPASNHESTAA